MATYRRSLAISFFFRYWHELVVKTSLVPAADLPDLDDIVNEIHRSVSGGSRDNSDPYAQEVLGRQIPHTSAILHSTGAAVYTDDIPKVGENEAYGALVVSSRAHARILNVDPSAALALPDVIDWVDHRDLPSPAANYWGPSNDEPFFAVDEVMSQGQPIGLILATTRFKAQEAARLVKVEYEDLPRIVTIEEAIERDSFFAYAHRMKRGKEIDEAMAEAEFVVEGESRMGGQEHFYLETNAAIVRRLLVSRGIAETVASGHPEARARRGRSLVVDAGIDRHSEIRRPRPRRAAQPRRCKGQADGVRPSSSVLRASW